MQNGQIAITASMLSSVIENLTGAIVLVNRDRRVILSNKMAEQMTRHSKSGIHGKRSGEVLGCVNASRAPGGCGFDLPCAFCSIKKIVEETFEKKSGKAFNLAEIELTEVGRRYLKVSTKYLIMDDLEAVLISMEDITKEKEKERLRLENVQLAAAMETAGAVCHELNQPLTVVSGYIQLILSGQIEIEPAHDHLQQMKIEIDRMERITRKLMAINVYRTKAYAGVSRILDLDESSTNEKVPAFADERRTALA